MSVSPGAGEIHVWAADLETLEFDAAPRSWLSNDERDRANRFHLDRDRRRFERRRCMLRFLLGRYLDVDPAAVRFHYGPEGKPELAGSDGLRFNVSHSDGHALYAFAQIEVGVDIERVRTDIDVDSIARTVFASGEKRYLEALPAPERVWAFFRYWVRKEAYIKAHGHGLSLPLHSFEVTLEAGQSTSFELTTFPGFSACVAVTEPCGAPEQRYIGKGTSELTAPIIATSSSTSRRIAAASTWSVARDGAAPLDPEDPA